MTTHTYFPLVISSAPESCYIFNKKAIWQCLFRAIKKHKLSEIECKDQSNLFLCCFFSSGHFLIRQNNRRNTNNLHKYHEQHKKTFDQTFWAFGATESVQCKCACQSSADDDYGVGFLCLLVSHRHPDQLVKLLFQCINFPNTSWPPYLDDRLAMIFSVSSGYASSSSLLSWLGGGIDPRFSRSTGSTRKRL